LFFYVSVVIQPDVRVKRHGEKMLILRNPWSAAENVRDAVHYSQISLRVNSWHFIKLQIAFIQVKLVANRTVFQ